MSMIALVVTAVIALVAVVIMIGVAKRRKVLNQFEEDEDMSTKDGSETGEEGSGKVETRTPELEDESAATGAGPLPDLPPPPSPPAKKAPVSPPVVQSVTLEVNQPPSRQAEQPVVYPPARPRQTVPRPSPQPVYEPEDGDERPRRTRTNGGPPSFGKALKWVLIGIVIFFGLACLIGGGIYLSKKMSNGNAKAEKAAVVDSTNPCGACHPDEKTILVDKVLDDGKITWKWDTPCVGADSCSACIVKAGSCTTDNDTSSSAKCICTSAGK